jgi:hypothetical protein
MDDMDPSFDMSVDISLPDSSDTDGSTFSNWSFPSAPETQSGLQSAPGEIHEAQVSVTLFSMLHLAS